MRVDDAWNRGNALTELPCNRKIVLIVAHRPDVDLRRESDIVDDQSAVLLRNDPADLVRDRLEYRLGAFDAGAGRRANVKLDLAAVDQREKVPADQQEHHRARAKYQHGDDRHDGPP